MPLTDPTGATSVGITARVFKDLDRSQSNEARVILGAAVIDDVLGLHGEEVGGHHLADGAEAAALGGAVAQRRELVRVVGVLGRRDPVEHAGHAPNLGRRTPGRHG